MGDQIGIDIGTYAIKMCKARVGGKTGEILDLASIYNPVGQYLPADQVEFQKLADSLRGMVNEHKVNGKTLNVSLPDSLAFTNIISLPLLSEAELASSIHWEAEQHIPIPMQDINLEYEILYKPKRDAIGEKMRVLLVGVKKEIIEKLVKLFEAANLELNAVETNSLAILRALNTTLNVPSTVAVVHMGALSTDLMLVNMGELAFTYTIHTGGIALTRAIEKALGLQPAQAEEYKRAYGLDQNQLEGKLRQVIMPVLNLIIAELKKAIQYNQTGQSGLNISSLVLSGGSVFLPGLSTYLADALGVEVITASAQESWNLQKMVKGAETLPTFIPAIGLALRP